MSTPQPSNALQLTLVPPARATGNTSQDISVMLDWAYRSFLALSAVVDFINLSQSAVQILQSEADATKTEADALKKINDAQLSGTVVCTDPDNSITITWGTPQPDTNYRVMVQPVSSTGTPAADSFIIASKTYTKTSFTFTLIAAPGAASSVTFEYQLIRNT